MVKSLLDILLAERDKAEGAVQLGWLEFATLIHLLGFSHPFLVSESGQTCWRSPGLVPAAYLGQLTAGARIRFLKSFITCFDAFFGCDISFVVGLNRVFWGSILRKKDCAFLYQLLHRTQWIPFWDGGLLIAPSAHPTIWLVHFDFMPAFHQRHRYLCRDLSWIDVRMFWFSLFHPFPAFIAAILSLVAFSTAFLPSDPWIPSKLRPTSGIRGKLQDALAIQGEQSEQEQRDPEELGKFGAAPALGQCHQVQSVQLSSSVCMCQHEQTIFDVEDEKVLENRFVPG